ncbi:MAG: bifunctional glutamate N-acetyltransferase/amino-acid acetyltransferase ArgJ, partial [Gemmatimonadetes bacterium]|nr:bifunctional glutamate N-acetyltransferase/amino-acid acetyltransferase ArgJ [Gemmatimonadota bacterium]
MAEFHSPARFPRGFRCAARNCGLKAAGQMDLAVFYSEAPAHAAAVFTRNRFPGAPVILGREIIQKHRLRAIVVNSKVANVAMGEQGIRAARRMGEAAAQALGVPAAEVLMSSTGAIGKALPIEKIEAALEGIAAELQDDPLLGARGMMTTDTYPKALSLSVGPAVITAVTKGSGMIGPNMATTLTYICTDAEVAAEALDRMLREAVADSLNMLSVDSDTSTSDTCAILANGLAGPVPEKEFRSALNALCVRVTEILARDGEGATKLLKARVTGAKNSEEARTVARSIINSPLVKTMVHGGDPNIGRLLMAVGKCVDCEIVAERLAIRVCDELVYEKWGKTDYDEDRVRALLSGDPVIIHADLGVGTGEATAYGCDLTHG